MTKLRTLKLIIESNNTIKNERKKQASTLSGIVLREAERMVTLGRTLLTGLPYVLSGKENSYIVTRNEDGTVDVQMTSIYYDENDEHKVLLPERRVPVYGEEVLADRIEELSPK